jgi:predicted RNA-binding protein with PUA-like domain
MLISSLLINLEGDKTYHRDDLMKVLGYGRREEILLNGKFEIYSVRNPQARNNLKEMKMGDPVLFVHIKQPRLSVIKLTKEEFEMIVNMNNI